MEAGSMSTSTDTIRTLHTRQHSPSPSPPDSPSLSASGSSVSSFPSVSSSFFFSSAAASPPHVPPLPLEGEGQLIIPELVLPAAHVVPRTPNLKVELKEEEGKGKAVTRLLILGPRTAAAAALCVDNPSGWVVEEDGLSVLRAEAAWRGDDVHDKSKSSGTLELVSLGEGLHQLSLPATTHRILTPFRDIRALLAPPCFLLQIGALVMMLPRDRNSALTRTPLDFHSRTANLAGALGVRRHPGFGSGFDDSGFGRGFDDPRFGFKDRGSAFDERGSLFD
ncbi:hypothetical protein B0H13DRAFT_2571416 [Mycena leptocephala]|nr:hypothetical protein B0H13DRAFT_2571416 [Mycena leptocephala]